MSTPVPSSVRPRSCEYSSTLFRPPAPARGGRQPRLRCAPPQRGKAECTRAVAMMAPPRSAGGRQRVRVGGAEAIGAEAVPCRQRDRPDAGEDTRAAEAAQLARARRVASTCGAACVRGLASAPATCCSQQAWLGPVLLLHAANPVPCFGREAVGCTTHDALACAVLCRACAGACWCTVRQVHPSSVLAGRAVRPEGTCAVLSLGVLCFRST